MFAWHPLHHHVSLSTTPSSLPLPPYHPQEPYGQGAESMALWNGINDQTATIPGVNTEPDAMDEQPPSPPLPLNTFTPINAPKPAPRSFSPLTSKAELKRRRLERERAAAAAAAAALAAANVPSNQKVASTAQETSDPDTITVARPTNGPPNQNVARTTPATSDPDIIIAQRTTASTRTISPYEAQAAKTYDKPPNDTPQTNDDDEDTIFAVPRRNPATTPVNPYEDQAAKTYNKPPNHAPKPDDHDDHEDTIVVNTQPRPARPARHIPQPASTSKAAARKSSKRPPSKGLASSALGNSSRESVDLRQLAAKNSIEGKELSKKSKKRPENATPNRFATPAGNNPSPSAPKPTEIAAAALKTLPGAYRQLDMLQTRLREEQDTACKREEHLTVMLNQARDLRQRAITDRNNGLVIINDRKRKLEDYEKRLKAGEKVDGEKVDHEEMLEFLKPLNLGVPVERETFEEMKRDGREGGMRDD
jgi:hypothetical protein